MKRKLATIALLVLLAPSINALEFSSLDYEPTVPYIMITGTGGTLGESVELVDANGGGVLAANAVIRIQIAGEITNGWFFFDAAAIAADPPAQVTVRTATEESAVYTLPPLPPPCIDKDWTAGAPITTECMPESDRSVFLEEEFFYSQGTSVRRLVEPEEWCRADLVQQRLYWPREAGANCAVWPQAQIDMSTAANSSRQYWEGLGCQDHYKPYTVTFEVEFTPLLMDFTGGAFSPLMGDGHIFLDSASVQASQDFRVGAVLHEMAHAAVQFSIFPSAIADAWGQSRLWPEAVATAAMIDQMPGSSYFAEIHGPWPDRWTGGLTFGRNKARHAALLLKYLNGFGFNSCEFMLNQHDKLIIGDEIGAFKAELPLILTRFAEFVAAYNMRTLPESVALQLPDNIEHVAFSPHNDIRFDLSGMKEGDSTLFYMDGTDHRICLTLVRQCFIPSIDIEVLISTDTGETVTGVGFFVDGVDYQEPSYQYCVSLYSHEILPAGNYVLTMASLEGIAFADRIHVNPWSYYEPEIPWPPSAAASDPWVSERQCQQ